MCESALSGQQNGNTLGDKMIYEEPLSEGKHFPLLWWD